MEENQHLFQHFRPKPKPLFIQKLLLALVVFIVLVLIEVEGLMQLWFPSLTSMNCSWAQTRNRAGALLYFFYPILRACKFSPECLPRALFKVHSKAGVGGAGLWITTGSPHSSAGLIARKNRFSFANESQMRQMRNEEREKSRFLFCRGTAWRECGQSQHAARSERGLSLGMSSLQSLLKGCRKEDIFLLSEWWSSRLTHTLHKHL